MKTASMADIQSRLSHHLRVSRKEPVLITRRGKPVGLLIAPDAEELDRLTTLSSTVLRAELKKSLREFEQGKTLSHEEFWRRVEATASKTRRNRNGPATTERLG
jgi:prevent-host-death family protein